MAYLLVAILLLGINAFMVGAEVAITAAAGRRSVIESQAASGSFRARMASASLRELAFMLTGAQFGITLASLGLGFVAEPAIADLITAATTNRVGLPEPILHGIAAAIAIVLIVFLHMVLGEMAPKNIAVAEPIRTMLWVAVPFRMYANAIRPILWLLNSLANLAVRALGVTPRNELHTSFTASQIGEMLSALRRIEAIEVSDYRLAQGAIEFQTRKARDIMLPRSSVVSVTASATTGDVEQLAATTGHSRFPVQGDQPDEYSGFVHVKDLLTAPSTSSNAPLGGALIRSLPVVPETATLASLLIDMRRRRSHMVMAIDEHGSPSGVITLEDLLEELVGEISDEFDPLTTTLSSRPERLTIAGSLRPDELATASGLRLPDGDYTTVAGFMLNQFGTVPRVGHSIHHAGWCLRVRRMDGPRVAEIDLFLDRGEVSSERHRSI